MAQSVPRARPRTPERIRHHFEVERALAARLRAAPRAERLHMLTGLYEELFRAVPDHPRLTRKHSPEYARRYVMVQMRFVRRFLRPEMAVLEIGPGDCAFAFELAKHVRHVYGVDVDQVLPGNAVAPTNFELRLSDGVSVPVPPQSVDLAYSNQLMEHLHPDDAREQLRNIFAALAPGGRYVCITPNRLNGPHDISRPFCDVPEGFHLKEYTLSELEALFRETGFREVAAFTANKGFWLRTPLALIRGVERTLERLNAKARRALGSHWPLHRLLSSALVATR